MRNEEESEREVAPSKVITIPEVRNKGSVQLNFTEKVYPHLAAREQHYKDPPLPKIKQAGGQKDNMNVNKKIQYLNPLHIG